MIILFSISQGFGLVALILRLNHNRSMWFLMIERKGWKNREGTAFLISVHNSVVMTVFNIGILDLSGFLFITLSCTNQGDISSMLPCFVLLLVLREVFFLFLAECPLNEFLLPLLLITFDRLPLLRRDSELFVLLFLFTAFLFAFELDLARLEAANNNVG